MSSQCGSQLLPISFLTKFCLTIILLSHMSHATVPAERTFTYTNKGDNLGSAYNYVGTYRPLPISTFPFTLCFYNETSRPNAFFLARCMGDHSRHVRRVWEANRGNPVLEDAELTLRSDGNLILSDADGTTAWQTGTANKGVVGLDLLPNGNLVFHDTKGKFVWHSFDFPTDTLLVGQSLRPNGPNMLVSCEKSGTDGYTYRFLLEQNPYFSLVMHRLSNDNSLEPLIYFRDGVVLDSKNVTLQGVTFYSEPNTQGAHSFTLGLALTAKLKSTNTVDSATMGLTTTKYNSTYSTLRIEPDRKLNIHTNYQYDTSYLDPWEVSYNFFDRVQCGLPSKCGRLGVCENDQCVACPTQRGLRGWTDGCAPPALKGKPCSGKGNMSYYEVREVMHFSSHYEVGNGPMKFGKCKAKCTRDCGCRGFFYDRLSSRCLLVSEIGTLSRVAHNSMVAYIKMPK